MSVSRIAPLRNAVGIVSSPEIPLQGYATSLPAKLMLAHDRAARPRHGQEMPNRNLVPVSEVRDTSQHIRHELRKQRGTSNSMILVPLFDLKFLTEFAASVAGTSNRRH